jgi:hypothetical protein
LFADRPVASFIFENVSNICTEKFAGVFNMIQVDVITFILINMGGFAILSKLGRLLGKQIKRAHKNHKELLGQ